MTDDELTEVAQSEDQGDGGQGGDPPYAEYLSRIPNEVRDDVEPIFKEWDANVSKKFQSHAEFRKQWEPFAETGIHQLPAEDVSWLVQFRQALDNPEVMQQWWEGYARENGLTPQQAEEAQAAAGLDDYQAYQDPNQQQLIEKLLEERLGPLSKQLEQFSSRFEQQDQAQAMAEASRIIDGQVAALEKEHNGGNRFDEETRDLVDRFASKYIESDPMNAITRGWGDYQRMSSEIEKRTLQGKLDQPLPAESGGVPSVSPEQHKRIDDDGVKTAALEFLRNNNRA
jgi:hypothetical protein